MLFAGWEVSIVKNCHRGLENAAQDCRPRAAFQVLIQALEWKNKKHGKNSRKRYCDRRQR